MERLLNLLSGEIEIAEDPFGVFSSLRKQITPSKLRFIPSNSSEVFMLDSDEGRFALKFGTRVLNKPYDKLEKEFWACRELSLNPRLSVSEPIAYVRGKDTELEILNWINKASTASQSILDDGQIFDMWDQILEIQETLRRSSSNQIRSVLNKHEGDIPYAQKLIKYIKRHMGIEISPDVFLGLDSYLNSPRLKSQKTIITDRNPTNWLITRNQTIIPIDFDMLLSEPVMSDFALYIDDHRLQTKYDRDQLVQMLLSFFANKEIPVEPADFHYCAIYRNLLHCAILFSKSKKSVPIALQKSLQSAEAIGDQLLVEAITALQRS